MPYRCDRCDRTWEDQDDAENDFRCLQRCGGTLRPLPPGPHPVSPPLPEERLARLPSVLAIPLRECEATRPEEPAGAAGVL